MEVVHRSNIGGPVGWSWLPMRLFLGITFLYAGLQKLTDPQFFHRSTPGYIGNQILAFAHGSPLHDLLLRFAVPHAVLFGGAVALGELAIGLGVLVGLLFRPAAFFGLLLSFLFFLTASWHVFPYFYGADIVFVFCWIAMLLHGPRQTGLPSLDALIAKWFGSTSLAKEQASLAWCVFWLLGGSTQETLSSDHRSARGASRDPHQRRFEVEQQARATRRTFFKGVLTGGVGALAVAVLGALLHARTSTSNGVSSSVSSSATQSTSQTIAQISSVPENAATTFTLPSSGDPGILVHLTNGQFVAYDATCTHAGCPVDYDPGSHMLVCPCHGATYDPAHAAGVLQGPTSTPLTSVSIHVDNKTGAVMLQ